MLTQRNNKAKCFQDCIIEKKKKTEWLEVSVRGRGGAGPVLVCVWGGGYGEGGGKWGEGRGGGACLENLKPFTLSGTPSSQIRCKDVRAV